MFLNAMSFRESKPFTLHENFFGMIHAQISCE